MLSVPELAAHAHKVTESHRRAHEDAGAKSHAQATAALERAQAASQEQP